MKLNQIKGMLFLLGAFSLAGTSVIAARFVTGKCGIFTITAVSLCFAILCLLPFCAKRLRASIVLMTARNWVYIFVQALFGIFLYRTFLLFGLLQTSSAEAGILTGVTPAVTAILARALLKEKISGKKRAGIACSIAGIVLVQGLLLPGSHFVYAHLIGNLLVICASICESLFNTCSRISVVKAQFNSSAPIHPIVQTTLVCIIALLLCVIPALTEQPVRSLAGLGAQGWLSLMWYGFFITALAFICWYEGIRRCSASTAAAFSGMVPFTALILSVLILGEEMCWNQWLGGLLIILGMVLIGIRDSISGGHTETTKGLIKHTV